MNKKRSDINICYFLNIFLIDKGEFIISRDDLESDPTSS